jgi:hypothetical protein
MDLPSNAPQMFQLPGTQNIPVAGGPWGQLAAGVGQGWQVAQQQQALQQKQQELQQEKQKIEIQKHEKMLEVGADMLINGGDDVQETGQRLIGQALPFVTGQPIPPNVAIDKPLAKGIQYYHNAVKLYREDPTDPLGLSPKDAVAGILQDISRKGLKQQTAQMDILKSDPMYKEGTADTVGGQVNGQPATQNKFSGEVSSPAGQPMPGAQGSFIDSGQAATLRQANQTNIANDFKTDADPHAEVLGTAANALNMIAHPVPENLPADQKPAIALQDKNALLKYAQVLIPASSRPPNMTMEDMLKSGLVKEIAADTWKHVTNNIPMTEAERSGIVQTLAKESINNEAQLTGKEDSHAGRAAFNQVNPMQALSDKRPPGVPSTSKLFKSPNVPGYQVQTGQIVQRGGKNLLFRGQTGTNDWKNPKNWMEIK